MPLTPVAWVDVNKKHIIDGAPALTEDSKLACAHGGVISIVPLDAGSAEEGDRNENAEDVVEEIKAEALDFAGDIIGEAAGLLAGRFIGKSGGKFVKDLVKKGIKKDDLKGRRNKGSGNSGEGVSSAVPKKASEVAEYVKQHNGIPPQGYVGGRKYLNDSRGGGEKLPEGVNYKEYDVNPKIAGQNRGAERIVIGDDGSVWYTNDHYKTFTRIE